MPTFAGSTRENAYDICAELGGPKPEASNTQQNSNLPRSHRPRRTCSTLDLYRFTRTSPRRAAHHHPITASPISPPSPSSPHSSSPPHSTPPPPSPTP